MTDQVVAADPALRRRVVWLLLAATVLGALALAIGTAQLREVKSVAVAQRWLWGAVGLLSGGGIVFGGYLCRLTSRVWHAGQFPLPNQRVIRDTPLRTGQAARRVGWMALAGAIALWAVSLALPLLLWRLLRAFPA